MKGFFVIGILVLATSMSAFARRRIHTKEGIMKPLGRNSLYHKSRPPHDVHKRESGFPFLPYLPESVQLMISGHKPSINHINVNGSSESHTTEVPQISAEPKSPEHHPSCLILTVSDILDLHFSESNINAITLLLQHSLISCPGLNSTFNIFQKIMNHKSLNFTNALDFIKTFEVGTTEKEKIPEESPEFLQLPHIDHADAAPRSFHSGYGNFEAHVHF